MTRTASNSSPSFQLQYFCPFSASKEGVVQAVTVHLLPMPLRFVWDYSTARVVIVMGISQFVLSIISLLAEWIFMSKTKSRRKTTT
jgi:hypothetical protein